MREERLKKKRDAEEDTDGQALYYCPLCLDVTDHRQTDQYLRCGLCGHQQRGALISQRRGGIFS